MLSSIGSTNNGGAPSSRCTDAELVGGTIAYAAIYVTKLLFFGLFQQSKFNLLSTALGAPAAKDVPSVWVAKV